MHAAGVGLTYRNADVELPEDDLDVRLIRIVHRYVGPYLGPL